MVTLSLAFIFQCQTHNVKIVSLVSRQSSNLLGPLAQPFLRLEKRLTA